MKNAMAQEQPHQVARVVVVDDDELLLRALTRLLSHPGQEVLPCIDATSALALVGAGGIDVVVSDIMMPGWSGIDLLREVRRHDLDLPVILMTGAPDLSTAVAAVELGAFSYLTKPVDASTFLATVERAIALGRVATAKREALAINGADDKLLGDRASLEYRFENALDQLWMAFQPIVSVGEQRAVAYEALLRTREPTLANPMAFLSAAERLGAVHALGRKIRHSVVLAAEKAPCDVDLFVNLHPLDLLDPQLIEPASPLSAMAPRIVLELTERASLDEVPEVANRVAALRALGFRIAVDDLGAGYAGLSSLTSLEPDVVKLDMSLVRGCDSDHRRQRVLASLLRLCRELDMTVVTEGIETAAERDVIAGFGGDLLQGYFYARPSQGFVVPRFAPITDDAGH
jgi:EAL domain-containing protein (putative c-di-GMP-specific phosphodiesterase class I)/FixJ family two-component response regulator